MRLSLALSVSGVAALQLAPLSATHPTKVCRHTVAAAEAGLDPVADNVADNVADEQVVAKSVPLTIENLGGVTVETGNKIFDPLGLASEDSAFGFLGEDKLAWYRHAELKHGRVAMLAFVGYLTTASGFTFGGYLSKSQGLLFSDLISTDPFAAWDKVPEIGKYQFYFAIGMLEFIGENEKPHYTLGGTPGSARFISDNCAWSWNKKTEARREAAMQIELKNGRLAMLGIIGLLAEAKIPGSVPFMTVFN